VFGSGTRFSGSADRMALFPVSPNPRCCAAILKNSNGDISAADRLIYIMFGSDGIFGVGGSNGAISGFAKSNMAAQPPS